MRIVCDDRIPFLRGVLEPHVQEVIYAPGAAIDAALMAEADGLLVRTRTRCDAALLGASRCRFVATATIGTDHLDIPWLEQAGIHWTASPGCNALSVQQYIGAAAVYLAERRSLDLAGRKAAVIGCGHVGTPVVRLLRALGMEVVVCDPPRAEAEGRHDFRPLAEALAAAALVSVHVPLTDGGAHPTRLMIGAAELALLAPGALFFNTSRGEVVDEAALSEWLLAGRGQACLDVWQNEPAIDPRLHRLCALATPHIAGYSQDGKAKGTSMVVRALAKHCGIAALRDFCVSGLTPPAEPRFVLPAGLSRWKSIASAILHSYPIEEDDRRLRAMPGAFEQLRGAYPPRREFAAYTIHSAQPLPPEWAAAFAEIGFRQD